jgi:hypothetical protein
MLFHTKHPVCINPQCREIGYEIHEEVLKILHELHTAMKTHHNYQSEFRQAETKLQVPPYQCSIAAMCPPKTRKNPPICKTRFLQKVFYHYIYIVEAGAYPTIVSYKATGSLVCL